MKPDTYQCASCGGTFEKVWSDEEAMAESREKFGEMPMEGLAVVCDDCWKKMGMED